MWNCAGETPRRSNGPPGGSDEAIEEDELPSRLIRDGILRSRRIAKLSPMAELFYRRLMSVADDFGRYYADPALLLSDCYPIRPDWASEEKVIAWLEECSLELLDVYETNGSIYLEIREFNQRIRPGQASKFPAFAGKCGGLREVPARASPPPPTANTPPAAGAETELLRRESAATGGEPPEPPLNLRSFPEQVFALVNGYRNENGRQIARTCHIPLHRGELLAALSAEAQKLKLSPAAVASVWARKAPTITTRSERAEDPEAYIRGAILAELAGAKNSPRAREPAQMTRASELIEVGRDAR